MCLVVCVLGLAGWRVRRGVAFAVEPHAELRTYARTDCASALRVDRSSMVGGAVCRRFVRASSVLEERVAMACLSECYGVLHPL